MIEFKVIKFKHYRQARALTAREEAGEDIEVEYLTFVISMVAEWDFVDAETGDILSIGNGALEELSLEQMTELAGTFNRKFGDLSTVKKTNDGRLPSTSPLSKMGESLEEMPRIGSTPSYSPGG